VSPVLLRATAPADSAAAASGDSGDAYSAGLGVAMSEVTRDMSQRRRLLGSSAILLGGGVVAGLAGAPEAGSKARCSGDFTSPTPGRLPPPAARRPLINEDPGVETVVENAASCAAAETEDSASPSATRVVENVATARSAEFFDCSSTYDAARWEGETKTGSPSRGGASSDACRAALPREGEKRGAPPETVCTASEDARGTRPHTQAREWDCCFAGGVFPPPLSGPNSGYLKVDQTTSVAFWRKSREDEPRKRS
jgi:hypothetical protein